MLHKILELPRNQKFLLGFSGGVDSCALFFLLRDEGINFDIAIVDYGVREQSKEEVLYAQQLAQKYGKQIFVLNAPKLDHNFESQARKVRFDFFKKVVLEHKYRGLILAHQLNDRIEWLLMQLQKGAGLNVLLGFSFCEEISGIDVFRPLLDVSKEELHRFCLQQKIKFFEDESNQDDTFLRNRFRKLSAFLMQNAHGIRSSFEYLREEKNRLYPDVEVKNLGDIRSFTRTGEAQDLHRVDLECKKMGYVLSSRQKQEIIKCQFSCEVHRLVIECNDEKIFVAPKVQCVMDEGFRDMARKNKIPKRLRKNFYLLWKGGIDEQEMRAFFEGTKT
ncbi:tRNA lysidine(34) synthetase TilS [Helicobacter kayseriensis]|uniref:tRNA lysidine(34) synthetase TilS n=1 Tax=Helicobacter kayseriensis TaxID=2905877 RepID=UPI001E3687FF|nr:tRNA lysidine(34) synthetase TilS [Helicobacter kayseriensis]MCE3048274.1 tRNA lysidine(34) synthetase TilS [Helicobacter kayseriensis]